MSILKRRVTEAEELVLKVAMEALAEKTAACEAKHLDPIYELFNMFHTGGEGTLSYSLVTGAIAELRVRVGLEEEPPPVGHYYRAIETYKRARASGEDLRKAAADFKAKERERAGAAKASEDDALVDEIGRVLTDHWGSDHYRSEAWREPLRAVVAAFRAAS